jgi:hypothetical protein
MTAETRTTIGRLDSHPRSGLGQVMLRLCACGGGWMGRQLQRLTSRATGKADCAPAELRELSSPCPGVGRDDVRDRTARARQRGRCSFFTSIFTILSLCGQPRARLMPRMDIGECGNDRPGFGVPPVSQKLVANNYKAGRLCPSGNACICSCCMESGVPSVAVKKDLAQGWPPACGPSFKQGFPGDSAVYCSI